MFGIGETAAQEAYAEYDGNGTLTFYCDNSRSSCQGLTFDLNDYGTGKFPGWSDEDIVEHITKVVFTPSFQNVRPNTMLAWFYEMKNLKSIEGMKDYLNTSEVQDMSCSFFECYNLESLDLSNFDTGNVTDMSCMFYFCMSLKSLDLSSFNTQNVTDMSNMFTLCEELKTIDLSSFNTRRTSRICRTCSMTVRT